MCQEKNVNKLSYIEKTGSAMRIGQTITALSKSNAPYKEIVVPKEDEHIAREIIKNRKLGDKIRIKSI
jgi:hypothetical protein